MKVEYPRTTMMTGATGFLGHYILRDLLNRGGRVVVVLRAPLAESANRLVAILKRIGVDLDGFIDSRQVVLVEGALPHSLPPSDWGQTDDILNCAASLQLFSNGNDDPYKTNVAGVEALIEWAHRNGAKRIHAVSTAYTCGWNAGLIKEEFHHPTPEFQTDYEKSKWTAEALLEQWSRRSGCVLTVLRPSLLIGDSITGYTTQFGGFYQFARLVGVLKKQYADPNNGARTYIPLRVPGRPNDPQNIVPVDFVSRVIAEVVGNSEFHGRIYHLTNPNPPTNEMIKQCYEEYFGLHGGYFADPQEVIGKCSESESLLWDQYNLLTPRLVHNPRFDMSNTQKVMQARKLSFPTLTRESIFRLFDYASSQGWGRQSNSLHS